jgi:hypothetical protein
MPYHKIGYVKNACKEALLNLEIKNEKALIGIYVTQKFTDAKIILETKDRNIFEFKQELTPESPFTKEVEIDNPPSLECRRSTLAWLWRMRCALDTDFKDPYTSICQKIASYSSDCGKKTNIITCRKRRSYKKRRFNMTQKNTK